MKASYQKYLLNFKRPSGTSRGILTQKETYFLKITDGDQTGLGECALFRGLSFDDVPGYEEKLQWLCHHINSADVKTALSDFPSILFGYEQALLNLKHGKNWYFPSEFTSGNISITINGLIWMGGIDYMQEQIENKLKNHFHCIKLKIGTNWEEEKKVITSLRKRFPKDRLELRVDANGAFNPEQAKRVLNDLYELQIHSIEQPIKAGQWQEMARLCESTPTPIALDEELIGVTTGDRKKNLLETIHPQYIILKPALVGGFSGSDEWIDFASRQNIGWWITSALESNVGLNALAQYTFTKKNPMPQGLGTGALFTNNTPSHLILKGDQLSFAV